MRSRLRSLACVGVAAAFAGVLHAQQRPARDAAAVPQAGTAVIAGTVVVDEPNGKPLRRVSLSLAPVTSGPTAQRVTMTDDAGRFAFTGLPAGNYSAPRAARAGYVPVVFGQKRTGGIGTPITLADGQRLTIALKMLRGAVITGMLVDQTGKPMAQVSVQATEVRVVSGQRTAVAGSLGAPSATTDDRGVYRIYGLPPGDYVVLASPRAIAAGEVRPITQAEIQWAQQQLQPQNALGTRTSATGASTAPPPPGQAVTYTQVYYPGTTSAANATIVTLAAGQERSGVDFGVQFVPTAKLEGTIVDRNGQPAASAQVNLVATYDSDAILSDSFFLFDSMMMMRPTVTNGRFSIAGVKPGKYLLSARAAPVTGAGPTPAGAAGRGGGPAAAMTLWATTEVTVDGSDQSGINLQLEPGMTLSGRIAFEGATLRPPADLSRVTLRLGGAPNPTGVTVSVGVPPGQVAADGTFKLEGITPGRYLISATAPVTPPVAGVNWLVKSALFGGIDVADVPLEVKPGQDVSNAVITFTDKTSEISGTLLDATGKPTPEFAIIVFSTDKTIWSQRSRRLRAPVRTSTDGKFKFANLIAGEYYLAALSDFEPNDYYNPVFLEQVAAAAMKITLGEGEKKVQDIKIAGG